MGTLICVPIMVQDAASALAQAELARAHGADMVEWRIDQVFSGDDDRALVRRLVVECPLPCIVTCRPTWEGGFYDGPEDERIALFEWLTHGQDARGAEPGRRLPAAASPCYIDCELAVVTRSANARMKVNLACRVDGGPSLILSMHDFSGRPTDLSRRLLAMRDERASVHKIAYHARSIRDNLDLFDMLTERDRPTIALGMGRFGLMSRVLAPKFGGLLTFASLADTSATAPGQPTIRELIDLFRFRSIGPTTRVYGVVGWPVEHSLSPLVHNAGFDAVNHDGVYLPMPVAIGERESEQSPERKRRGREGNRHQVLGIVSDHPEREQRGGDGGGGDGGDGGGYASLKATLLELINHPRLDLAGLSVTIPHKRNLYRLADERGWAIDPLTARIGAANTVTVRRDGSESEVSITNTDAAAARACLADALGELIGKHVVVIGAGGVARAIVVALVEAGARVTVCNRTRSRAEALADELGDGGAIAVGELDSLGACDALVNCTPVGMAGGPSPDESPAADALLTSRPVVFDTVYTPIVTPLLRLAGGTGCETIDGVTMFVRQAAAQFALWTGKAAPMALFDRVVREALGGVCGERRGGKE